MDNSGNGSRIFDNTESCGKIVIRKYSNEDLDKFRRLCNFTADERTYFELCLKRFSHVKIALEMHVSESTVSNLAKRVKSKIRRISDSSL